MPKSIHAAIGMSGLVILVTTLMFATPGHVAAQFSPQTTISSVPVRVTNTPLPVVPQGVTSVTGNVAVTGLPPVQVEALPPVAIDPLGNTVQVGNSATNPVLVRNVDTADATEVFENFQFVTFADETFHRVHLLTVPAGKRLVIEHYSGKVYLPSGQLLVEVRLENGLHEVDFPVPQLVSGPGAPLEHYVFNHQTRLNFAPGQVVRFLVSRDSFVGTGFLKLSLHGYFVPVTP